MARRLTVRLQLRKTDRKWEYTLVTTVRVDAGLQTMEEYIQQRQNTVAQYIDMESLLYLCEGL